MIYISIKIECSKKTKKTNTVVEKVLSFFLPKANPDFDKEIDLVSQWLLEFEDEDSIPNREIGLSSKNKALMKMPYKNNYGYWSDNSLTYSDFKKSFSVLPVNEGLFNKKWKEVG